MARVIWAILTGLSLFPALLTAEPLGDPAQGAILFKGRCITCHQGTENPTAPDLNGILGRAAGSLSGYDYSPAMRAKGAEGLVWSEVTLTSFLSHPRGFIPGSRMAATRMHNTQERNDIIAYLLTISPKQIIGDPEYGAYLAQECSACHLAEGAPPGIPMIHGQTAERITQALQDYRSKTRENPVMQMIASQFGDAEIAALAAHLSEQ